MNNLLLRAAILAEDSGSLIIKTKENQQGLEIKSPLRGEITDISSLIDLLIKFLFPFAAVVLLVMFIYGGFIFMTAQGKQEAISKGQRIFISSIAGFILLVLAFFLVRILAYIFALDGGGILPQ